MLLTLFSVFLVLALTCIFLGYYAKESAYSLIGWSFIFFLATSILLPGNLEYKTGETNTHNYICQSCTGTSFPTPAGNESQISSIVSVDDYATLDSASTKFFGIWLMFSSIAGIAISLSEIQSAFTGKKNWRSD